MNFSFHHVPHLICASGASRHLGDHLPPGLRPLIISDRGIAAAGLLDGARQSLAAANRPAQLFLDVVADPPQDVVHAAIKCARDYKADIIIGLGGGSAMDTAKLVAVLAHNTQSLNEIYGVDKVQGSRSLPLVLIPTTAGTGSEVTPVSIVTTGASTKMGVVARQLYADIAILDAELTLVLPPTVTAHTGIDAMVHAIEAYTSQHKKNPLSDMLAREAMRLLWQHLPIVMKQPTRLEARQAMLLGSCLAGQAFANAPVAAVHALAYPLGGRFHLSHGLSNALMLPHVLRFNEPAADTLYHELGAVVGCGDHFIDALEQLCVDTGIPRRLRDTGITTADIDQLADDAMDQNRLLINNPRTVTRADAHVLYTAAL